MNIHYAKEFENDLKNGVKIHTIRKKAIPAGTVLKHVVYPYTKNKRRVVLENVCTGSQKFRYEVISDFMNLDKVFVDDVQIEDIRKLQILAWADGFQCLAELQLFFRKNTDFLGVDLHINHWTNKRY